jgi:hypothetical protein
MKWLAAIVIIIFTAASAHSLDLDDSVKTEKARTRNRYMPHYFPLQYAGNIGFLSAGVGYAAKKDNYQLSLIYGYAPPALTGVRIHTITAKNIFHFYRFQFSEGRSLVPYGAMGLSAEVGGRSFLTLPSNMPRGYYAFPKSAHIIASAGIKLRYRTDAVKPFRGFEFFMETTTVDAYIWYKFLSDEIKMRHILSHAVGIHFLRR